MYKLTLVFGNVLAFCAISASAQVDVLTQHNDLQRTGWNNQETQLNIKNVKTGSFTKLFSDVLDDKVCAQPLVVTGVSIPGTGVRNVVYVATVNNTVYAFDADSARVAGAYWQVSLTPAGTRPPMNTDMTPPWCGGTYHDFSGNMGIVGTPVIDKAGGTIYLVSRSVTTSGTKVYTQYLHALDIRTGAEKAGSPVTIAAQVNGTGDGSAGGVIKFDPQKQNQRPGLLLLNGVVYIGYASHCDWDPYHGWLLGYDAATLQQKIVYNTTPGGEEGGIWMSGAAPAADASGNIFLSTGNGTVGVSGDPLDVTNRGEGVVKLTPSGSTLGVSSFFTPFNYEDLDAADLDFGASNVMLIPNTQLVVTGSKEGKVYLLDQNDLGGYSATSDNVLQTIDLGPSAHMRTALTYYKGASHEFVYTWPENTLLRAFPVDRAARALDVSNIVLSGIEGPTGNSGSMMSTTSNGSVDSTGILWVSHSYRCDANQNQCQGILRAVNANNVSQELWNSKQVAGDNVGNYSKFVCPTIANGKVYLASNSGLLLIYGLTNGTTDTCNSTNRALNKGATASSAQSVATRASSAIDGNLSTAWASNSTNTEWIYTDLAAKYDLCRVVLRWQLTAGIDYNIDVSDDAGAWTTIATVRGGDPSNLNSTINLHGSGRYVRMQGITPGIAGGYYAISEMEVYGNPTVTCAPPVGFSTTDQPDGSVLLSWQTVGNASGYVVQYRNVNVSSWSTISSNTNSVILPALSCGYDYVYQVASKCTNGQQGAFSASGGFFTPACPANCPPLPTRWSSADIGNVGVAGSACYNTQSLTYTIKGSGGDVGGNSDAFRFAYVTVVGDNQIVARITSQDDTDPDNKAGIMIRESSSSDARNAFIGITHGQGGVFQYRTSTGGATIVNSLAGIKAPYWIKLVKIGSGYGGYLSPDGFTWTKIGPTVDLGFGASSGSVYAGLAITSHNNTMLSSINADNFSQSIPTPLPVTLTSFTGKNINDQYVALQWSTASEENTGHFEVERCTDGIHFRTVLTVKAVGNSRVPQQYRSDDPSPAGGLNYYRLKQVDLDGNYAYSPVILVRIGKRSAEPLLFPNPANGIFNIVAGRDPVKEVNLYDVSGKKLSRLINASASSSLMVPCANLAPGIYIVEIRTNTQQYLKKLIKN